MKTPSNPPVKALTPKRKKILAMAMAQLKKTRAQMDPAILKKIRRIIAANPKIMRGLGVDKMPEENKEEKIDQAKNMDTIAKLMALKPSEIKNIKEVLLKSKD